MINGKWKEAAYLIRDIGFPIAVAGFLLWRVDVTLDGVSKELRALTAEIRLLVFSIHGSEYPSGPRR